MKPMKPMAPMKPMEKMEPMKATERWWPGDLGEASSTGSADDTRYAYFASTHRLAVERGGKVTVYDTGRRAIHGVAQSSGGSALRFSTADGTVGLDDLKAV